MVPFPQTKGSYTDSLMVRRAYIMYDLYRAVRCAVHTRIRWADPRRCEDIRLGEEAVGHLHIFRISAERVFTFEAWYLSIQGPRAPTQGDSFSQWRVVSRGLAC